MSKAKLPRIRGLGSEEMQCHVGNRFIPCLQLQVKECPKGAFS